MNINQTKERFTKLLIQFGLEQPYYGVLLSHFSRNYNDKLDCSLTYSLMNTGQPILHVNTKRFFLKYPNEKQQVGCLIHQMLHYILGHHNKIHQYSNVKQARFDLAADLHTNLFIKEFSSNEKNSILMLAIPRLKVTDEKPFDHIINGLNDKNLEFLLNNLGNSYFFEDALQHNIWRNEQWTSAKSAIANNRVKKILLDIHISTPPEFFEQLPASLQRHINTLTSKNTKNQLDWKSIVNRHIGNSSRLAVKHSLRRVSKRYGTFPGLKIKKKVAILVALDTSASIKKENLEAFWMYITELSKTGAELYIVESDAAIRKTYPFHKQQVPSFSKGGGGTNFTPVIELANKRKANILLYFTDGKANAPQVKPNIPVLWLLTENNTSTTHLPGRIIQISNG